MDQEKRLKILGVAKEYFEHYGFKKTTVDEIASGAGISKRTLYEMFCSKENILSELVMNEAYIFSSIVNNKLKNIKDPFEKLKTITKMSIDYFRNDPFLGKVLNDQAGLYAPYLQNEIKIIEENIEELFYNVLSEGTNKGVFRKMDEKAYANCIFVLFRSFTYARTIKPNKAWVNFIADAILKSNGDQEIV